MLTKTDQLGTILVKRGLISPQELEGAIAEQSATRERLGEILCRRGLITQSDLLDALCLQNGCRRYDPKHETIEPSALELVPFEFARRHNLIPVRMSATALVVAMADPTNVEALDRLRHIAARVHKDLEIALAQPEVLDAARESHYGRIEGNRSVSDLINKVVDEVRIASPEEEETDTVEAQRRAQEAGVVQLVDQIIDQALQERATDIHVEPQSNGLIIRYRVDGMLYDALSPPRAVYTGLTSRMKILSNMDIAERRSPQDGRFSHGTGARQVDVRVSSVPTIHGEKMVLRLLDRAGFDFSLRDLGFSETDHQKFSGAIHQPYGMVLLSGPTGSGKSTTLYAGLLELRAETLNIMTVEDPVEYQINRINQVQVNERKRVTFANALRAFLRQDPDVIMVGEIRDGETAEIAVRAALTGHLVFSTIHANDAPSTATRLTSMGVEAFMAASALSLVAAQRLVRRNCKQCSEPYAPSDDALLAMGPEYPELARAVGTNFRKGAGCTVCKGRGYKGRVAILETMPLSPGLRQLMAENKPAGEIRRLAINEGLTTLRRSGFDTAMQGTTTVEEVLRVCLSDD